MEFLMMECPIIRMRSQTIYNPHRIHRATRGHPDPAPSSLGALNQPQVPEELADRQEISFEV